MAYAALLGLIVSQGQRRAEQFPASCGTVFGEFWRSGEDVIDFRDEPFQGS
jgi:hypothetical protein